MNPQEIEAAILNAMKKANPGAEKAQKLTELRSEATTPLPKVEMSHIGG